MVAKGRPRRSSRVRVGVSAWRTDWALASTSPLCSGLHLLQHERPVLPVIFIHRHQASPMPCTAFRPEESRRRNVTETKQGVRLEFPRRTLRERGEVWRRKWGL